MAVEETETIDFVVLSPDGSTVGLVLVEAREWAGEQQLYQLQEKVNAYTSFALEGGLARTYPSLAGKQVVLELRCVSLPTGEASEFISKLEASLAEVGLGFKVTQIGAKPMG